MGEEEFVGKRRRSKVRAYYHLVWATKGRQPMLTDEYERRIYRNIHDSANRNGMTIIAIGGMPDHVHVVISAPGKYGPSDIAKLLKGPASAFMNDLRPPFSALFRWQDGFGCFTLSRSHLDRASAYVNEQKQHHAAGTLWPEWEETDEEAPDSVDAV